jgi:oligoendopeptidase F
VRNVANDVPDAAVDALLEVCAEQAPVFQRYFRWKATKLDGGLEGATPGHGGALRRYDLYAPLAESAREVGYSRAVDLVLDTFYDFDSRLGLEAERVLAEGHLDGEVRKGKKGGAFCATVSPKLTPWVLVNYTGRVRDVATLAHELGHAVHSLLASGHDVFTQHACLPLAETASVFAEILVTDRLLREEKNPAARRELLAAALDDMYATVLRQAWFTRFEIAAHEAVLAGRSSEELSQLYLRDLRQQFGDAVDVPEEFGDEWVTIPHLYQTPFYCYAYSFGQLLVLSLYRRYQEEGERFKPGYFRLLAHGGSGRPLDILAEAGVDPTDREFWRGGFEVVRSLVAEIEAL